MFDKRPKMSLDKFCNKITANLVKTRPAQEMAWDRHLFSEEEAAKLQDGLLVFRVVVLNLLLMFKAMGGKVKKKPFEIGLVVSNSTKQAMVGAGYDKDSIEKLGLAVVEDIQAQVKDLQERDLSSMNNDSLRDVICGNFAGRLVGGWQQENTETVKEKEAAVARLAAQVYIADEQAFEKLFNDVRVVR